MKLKSVKSIVNEFNKCLHSWLVSAFFVLLSIFSIVYSPSISFLLLIWARSPCQQAKQGSPDVPPTSANIFQPFLLDSEAFPSQMPYIIPPVCLPQGLVPVGLAKKTPKGRCPGWHPDRCSNHLNWFHPMQKKLCWQSPLFRYLCVTIFQEIAILMPRFNFPRASVPLKQAS